MAEHRIAELDLGQSGDAPFTYETIRAITSIAFKNGAARR